MNRRLYSAIAINTEEADLSGLGNIREKILIGKYALRGRGVGSDIDLGASIAEKSLAQMMDSIDVIVRNRDPEAFWIAAGLGSGTGAGGSFVLANELRNIYKHIPVYGIGVVPSVPRNAQRKRGAQPFQHHQKRINWFKRASRRR